MGSGVKPNMFIGSSAESKRELGELTRALEDCFEYNPWPCAFSPSTITLEELERNTKNSDFALFLFKPEDLAEIRGEQYNIARDNVLFEIGLFMGALGRKRCFILKPRGADVKWPSDLLGVKSLEYDADRRDGQLYAAFLPVASELNERCKILGGIDKKGNNIPIDSSLEINFPNEFSTVDLKVLASLMYFRNFEEEGVTRRELDNFLRKELVQVEIDLSLLIFEKMKMVERKVVDTECWGRAVCFSLTSFGVDVCFNARDKFQGIIKGEEGAEDDTFLYDDAVDVPF